MLTFIIWFCAFFHSMNFKWATCRVIETVTPVIMLIPISPGKNRETQTHFHTKKKKKRRKKLVQKCNESPKRLRVNFGVTSKTFLSVVSEKMFETHLFGSD